LNIIKYLVTLLIYLLIYCYQTQYFYAAHQSLHYVFYGICPSFYKLTIVTSPVHPVPARG